MVLLKTLPAQPGTKNQADMTIVVAVLAHSGAPATLPSGGPARRGAYFPCRMAVSAKTAWLITVRLSEV